MAKIFAANTKGSRPEDIIDSLIAEYEKFVQQQEAKAKQKEE